MARALFLFIIILHGAIHLIGFLSAFSLIKTGELLHPISKPAGFLWLWCSMLFVAAGVLLAWHKPIWWIPAVAAIVLSQILIILAWQDAKTGTIANAWILAFVVIAFGQWQFNSLALKEKNSLLAGVSMDQSRIDRSMITPLPALVQKWLLRTGVVGKEKIQSVHLRQIGEMRTTVDGKWMKMTAEQWLSAEKPGFLWLAEVQASFGLYLAGKDKYENGHGHMLIKLLSLFPVVDAKSREIDQGTMVRYLAEMIWFPSAALQQYVHWTAIDSSTAQVDMTYAGLTVTGYFKFNNQGDVISFSAQRYYDRKQGATLEEWLINMDPNGYRVWHGIRIPGKSSVTWKLKDRNFTWCKLEIVDIAYNVSRITAPAANGR
jgi:hypothetical protein